MGPLFIPMLIIMIVFAAAVLLGVALTVMLVFLGIVSSSVIIGFLRKQPSAGVRAFVIQGCAVAGIVCGIVGFWLARCVFELELSWWPWTLYAAICGLLFGVLIAGGVNYAWNRVYRWTRK